MAAREASERIEGVIILNEDPWCEVRVAELIHTIDHQGAQATTGGGW